jgi:tRNA-modifying protein YgfZ
MTRTTPLLRYHQGAEALLVPYGPAEASEPVHVVATFGELDLEYAAIRKSCVLIDAPYRGVIEVRGDERIEFLNRMVTQELRAIEPWQCRRSFWLNRKGRIDGDLRVWHFAERTLLECDIHAVDRVRSGLGGYVVMEDVTLADLSASAHRFSLHGPTSRALVAAVSTPIGGGAVGELADGRSCEVSIGSARVVACREDQTGEFGLELLMDSAEAERVYLSLIEAGVDPGAAMMPTAGGRSAQDPGLGRAVGRDGRNGDATGGSIRLRPSGWHAFNIARIEAGTAVYNLDFGSDSLPAETGVMEDRVSLTKGCYLGQEIVARMHARGHPKRRLVSVRFERALPLAGVGEGAAYSPRQPETGASLYDASSGTAEAQGEAIGAVTSSAISPMLGATPIALAMVKWERAKTGVEVLASAEGGFIRGVISDDLRQWRK